MNENIKLLYIIFGVFPATFCSFFWSIFSVDSLSKIEALITLAALTGTVGLYKITFSKTPNSKASVMLLIVGQIVMISMIPWEILSFSPIGIIGNLAWLFMMLGPIIVALHYQLTYLVSKLISP